MDSHILLDVATPGISGNCWAWHQRLNLVLMVVPIAGEHPNGHNHPINNLARILLRQLRQR